MIVVLQNGEREPVSIRERAQLVDLVRNLWSDEPETRLEAASCAEQLRALHLKLEPPPEPPRVEHFPFTWEMTDAGAPEEGLIEVKHTEAEYWAIFEQMTAPTESFEHIDLLRKAEHRLPTYTYTAEKCVGPSAAGPRLRLASRFPVAGLWNSNYIAP